MHSVSHTKVVEKEGEKDLPFQIRDLIGGSTQLVSCSSFPLSRSFLLLCAGALVDPWRTFL